MSAECVCPFIMCGYVAYVLLAWSRHHLIWLDCSKGSNEHVTCMYGSEYVYVTRGSAYVRRRKCVCEKEKVFVCMSQAVHTQDSNIIIHWVCLVVCFLQGLLLLTFVGLAMGTEQMDSVTPLTATRLACTLAGQLCARLSPSWSSFTWLLHCRKRWLPAM